jgi:hypothetical protein
MLSCENLELKRDKRHTKQNGQASFGHLMAFPYGSSRFCEAGALLP